MIAETLTEIAIKLDAFGEGLLQKKKKDRKKKNAVALGKAHCKPPGFCEVPPMKSQKNLR